MNSEIEDVPDTQSAARRPNVCQWFWYAWGGRLPQHYREWVLRDITTRTWLLRHMVRALVQTLTALVIVLAVLLFVVHAALWIALAAIALGVIVSVYYSVSYAWESGDVRLTKYGYPGGYGSEVRRAAADERDQESAERYNAQWRQGTE
ncbi:MAG TPA: DUF5313 family protein [Pseudonocardiaceae bacterium]|jgi:hypothetical protein|nr:DUF5313 family protein [Pseudonocardiaceae bacterium]